MAERSVLILSRHAAIGASSRLRMFQYIPALERAGFEVTVAPFFDEAYLRNLYSGRTRRIGDLVAAYGGRIAALTRARRFSVAWVQAETFPFLPGAFESTLSVAGVPYVVDYDDAIFHNYDMHRSALVRALLGSKLRGLLRRASCVTAGNAYLEDYAAAQGAGKTARVPTVVDTTRYPVTRAPEAGPLRVGWIGSPSTSRYLRSILPAIEAFGRRTPCTLVTVGAPPLSVEGIGLEQYEWSEDSEAAHLASLHVGIMPLSDTPWERGKCGYKLIQYMACARPAIASPVGVNREIVSEDVGFLACDEGQWVAALERLAGDAALRDALGARARQVVESRYSLAAVAPRVVEILRDAARAD